MGWPAVIILHTVAGKPLGVRLGRDLIYETDPVIVSIDGEAFEIRETKEEIAAIIRDV
jgi:hypothetical protein